MQRNCPLKLLCRYDLKTKHVINLFTKQVLIVHYVPDMMLIASTSNFPLGTMNKSEG